MMQEAPTITGPQMLAQGRQYRKDIEGIRAHIQNQADSAKEDKDVIRLNCLLDKLTQLGAREKSMEQSLQSLEEAVMRQAASDQLHEYTRITIIHQKVEELRTEADACVGAETNYVGPTKVTTETPPGLPEGYEKPTPAGTPPFTGVDITPPASPFQ